MKKTYKDSFGFTLNEGDDIIIGIRGKGGVHLHSGIVEHVSPNLVVSYNSWEGEKEIVRRKEIVEDGKVKSIFKLD